MTAGQLKTLIAYHVKAAGQQYITADADLYTLISRRLRMLSHELKCLYNDAIDFTPVNGTAIYDYTSASSTFRISASNRALVEVRAVIINGAPLYDFMGKIGMVNQEDMTRLRVGYTQTASSNPIHAWVTAPGVLHLWPKPTATVVSDGNNYISAFYEHPTVTASGDSVLFPEPYMDYVATDCAIELCMPYAQPDSAGYVKIMQMRQMVDGWKQDVKATWEETTSLPSIRGHGLDDYSVKLGYGSNY